MADRPRRPGCGFFDFFWIFRFLLARALGASAATSAREIPRARVRVVVTIGRVRRAREDDVARAMFGRAVGARGVDGTSAGTIPRLRRRGLGSTPSLALKAPRCSGATRDGARGEVTAGARCDHRARASSSERASTSARRTRRGTTTSARALVGLEVADLRAAILDGHSAWWAVASPLFALSVVPYLVFLKRLNEAKSATLEMRQAFATLLLFVIISIPAEAYTKRAYGEVLSNIDALHFLIQSAISLTNLRILLAFRDGKSNTDGSASSNMFQSNLTDFGTIGRPGAIVEAFAGLGLLATSLLLSLDERLLVVPDTAPTMLTSVVDSFRTWGNNFESTTNSMLGLPYPMEQALSVPTWGVHVFSLVEWLLAMGLVWNYADCERGNNNGWRTLTWGMLPLHASGICACTQHFFGNVASLDWLVAAQGAFTMLGNVGMCVAAGELAKEDSTSGVRDTAVNDEQRRTTEQCVVFDDLDPSWWDFDVENFGTKLWAGDSDGVFITKVALLSLAVASGVRGLSLSLAPEFDPVDGAWRDYTNILSFLMVATPLALNIEKWKSRERVAFAREALNATMADVDDVSDTIVDRSAVKTESV